MSLMIFKLAPIYYCTFCLFFFLFFSGEMKLVHSQVTGDLAERRGTKGAILLIKQWNI